MNMFNLSTGSLRPAKGGLFMLRYRHNLLLGIHDVFYLFSQKQTSAGNDSSLREHIV